MTDDFSTYGLPFDVVAGLVFDGLFVRARSFRADALRCVSTLQPAARVLGVEHIPDHGPCVVTVNHYTRPGFDAWWIALTVAAAIPLEMHWVITAELLYWGRLGSPLSRWILARVARTYGFTTMPPLPPRPEEVEARARSVRQVLDRMKSSGNCVLGLAPEGMDPLNGRLMAPAPGVGRFGLLLAGLGAAFVPAGVYEMNGGLCLRFGPAYHLKRSSVGPGVERDQQAARTMMKRIAEVLPAALRGEFV